jgi:glucose-1-phosphatase
MKNVLIFDLSEVLIEGLYGVVESLAKRLRIPQSDVLPGLGGEPLVALLEGRVSESTYWQLVRERTQWGIADDALSAMVRDTFRRPVPGMPELLASLRGHRLVLLSDHAQAWWEYIEATHPFLQWFERRFLSFSMGQTKRQMATFQRVLMACGCEPHECVFLDDLRWNVERAEAVGIRSHTFTSIETLVGFLDSVGIPRREGDAAFIPHGSR